MRDHAMVGPYRLALDVPARLRTSIVSTMPKPLPSSSLRSCTTCVTCRVYATSTPPRCMARAACLAARHGSGRSSTTVEIGFVDALVGVADLDLVVRQRILTQERGHVALGPAGEVLPQLVTGHHRAGPHQRHRQRRRPDPRLEHAGAGEDVGEHEDRAQVLGVDHLGTAGILSTKSARVGRMARNGEPCEDRNVAPSAAPMTSSWPITPAWVWNSPMASVTR